MEPAGSATRTEVSSRPRDPPPSRVETIQRIIRKAGFSQAVARVAAADLQRSTADLYRSKWSQFLDWFDRRQIDPSKVSIPQVAEIFLYLHQELGLSVPAVKGYQTALNHGFFLTEMDLAASHVVSQMFHSFEWSCPPQDI